MFSSPTPESARWLRRASAKRQKINGDSMAPCLTPLVSLMFAVVPRLLTDLKVEPLSRSAMTSMSGIPRRESTLVMHSWSQELKAFMKST